MAQLGEHRVGAMSPDGTAYEAIVIAAYNAAGRWKFIVVDPGYWCGGCTY